MPLSGGHSLLSGSNGGMDFLESFKSVNWQSNGLVDGVNQPAQYDLDSAPSGIPLLHFLDGSWLLSMGIVLRMQSAEYRIQSMQQYPFGASSLPFAALCTANCVVHKHILVMDRLFGQPMLVTA